MNNLDMSSAFEGRAEDWKKTKIGEILGNKQNEVDENDIIIRSILPLLDYRLDCFVVPTIEHYTHKPSKEFKTLDDNAIIDSTGHISNYYLLMLVKRADSSVLQFLGSS